MDNDWLESLHASGFDLDMESTGDLILDARHAVDATIIAPLSHLGLIKARGDDALCFLHNLLSNDVNSLGENELRRAALCTPKGRMLADFLLWHDTGGITLQFSADLLPAILKKLTMYVLRSKVKLADASESLACLGLSGPQAVALLQLQGLPQPGSMQQQAFKDGTVLCLGAQRFEIVLAAGKALALWKVLCADAQPVGIAAWRGLDIAAGIPLITAGTMEEFVPQMVNYELIGGVSFKKGCYPGQEIVARTQHLGKIKRRMYRGHTRLDKLAPGTPVYAPETGEQACGNVVSSAPSPLGGLDLLLVAQSSCVAAGEIHLGDPSGPLSRILPLPYLVE
ncbi:MAG: folate-binding protein YgfZ [Georgfuchsia sp.]